MTRETTRETTSETTSETTRRRRILYAALSVALAAVAAAAFVPEQAPGWLRLAGVFAFYLLVWTASAAVTGRNVPWSPAGCARREESGKR